MKGKRINFSVIFVVFIVQFSAFADDNKIIQREITFLSVTKDGAEIKDNYSSFGNLVTANNEDVISIQLTNNLGIQETFKLSTLFNNIYVFAEHYSPFGAMINGATGTFSRSADGKFTVRIYKDRKLHYEFIMQLYEPKTEIQNSNQLTIGEGDLYIAGYTYSWMPGHISRVGLIKNGKYYYLTDGNQEAVAYSMAVNGSDIYVAGQEGNVAKYWMVDLNDNIVTTFSCTDISPSCIYSIFVSGKDIYMAGVENKVAKYWIINKTDNSIRSCLLTDGKEEAKAVSIVVSGLSIHVAGYEGAIAKYWKNNIYTSLTDGNKKSAAASICVSRSDVYISGIEGNAAVYWKNGVPVTLPGDNQNTGANSIFVSGPDVYCGGWSGKYATYWKNGVPVDVSNGNKHKVQVARDKTINIEESHSSVVSLVVADNNVHCIISMGYSALSLGGGASVYWVNGIQTSLEIRPTSIIVVKNGNNELTKE
jgi:hypothetical protein